MNKNQKINDTIDTNKSKTFPLLERYLKHCDIELVNEITKEKWRMNSVFLKCKSSYFEALLSKQWNSTEKTQFVIQCCDSWEDVYHWIFTNEMKIAETNFCSVLFFADMYGFDELFNILLEKLKYVDFSFIKPCIKPLMSSRYFEILMKHRQQIVDSYYEPSPLFSLLSTIVSREMIRKRDSFSHVFTDWIISSNFSGYSINCGNVSFRKSLTFILLPGLMINVKSIKIKIKDSDFSFFGVSSVNNIKSKDLILDQNGDFHNSDKFYNKFVIVCQSQVCQIKSFYIDYNIKLLPDFCK